MNEMIVEIFGKGCKNCEKLEANFTDVANEMGLSYQIKKVKDMDEIVSRGVFKTPGLAIDGKIVSTGKVLSKSRIKQLVDQ